MLGLLAGAGSMAVHEAGCFVTGLNETHPLYYGAASYASFVVCMGVATSWPVTATLLYASPAVPIVSTLSLISEHLQRRSKENAYKKLAEAGVTADTIVPHEKYHFTLWERGYAAERNIMTDERKWTYWGGSTVHVDDYRDENGIVNYTHYWNDVVDSFYSWLDVKPISEMKESKAEATRLNNIPRAVQTEKVIKADELVDKYRKHL